MDKRTMAGDSVITIIGLILSTYAGSRMMTQAAWECNNPNFGYYATPPEVKDCISRPGMVGGGINEIFKLNF